MEDFTLLSARLKSLRKSHQLTQKELGNYLNISKQGYSHYENGSRIPDLYMLKRLANLYGLTISALLALDGNAETPTGTIAERLPPSKTPIKALSYQEQTLLKLFSQLPQEDKDDFMDLLSTKLYQTKMRKSSHSSKQE